MAFLEKILGKIIQKFWPEKIPEFAASIYITLAKEAKTRFYETVAKEIIERINQRGDVRNILDIGTGPGFMLFEIAKLRPDLTLVGVDLSKKLIEFADNEKVRRGHHDVFFLIGDANHLVEFSDNDCDFVISSGALHSLKNPGVAMREWLRVLKSGHDLWIYDPTVLINESPANLIRLLEEAGKKLKYIRDRLLLRIMRRTTQLPPRLMAIERISEIIGNAGIIEPVAVENRGTYLKISIVKK